MELHCEHCRSPSLPLVSLSFCRECRVSFCSQCCQDNHSASGVDGSLRFHRISKWSEALQCDVTQLVVNQLNDQMEQIKRHGETELELIGNGMDQVKAFLQVHAKAQMENRLSRVRESITKVHEALNVADYGITSSACTSPHTFAAEAKFLLGKFVISEVLPESSQATNIVERAAALVASLCATDDPTDGSIGNLTCAKAVTLHTQVQLSSEGNKESRTTLQTCDGMQPEQIAPLSGSAELNARPTEEIKDPSTKNHPVSTNVYRESSTLSGATSSNDSLSLVQDLDIGPEYDLLREEKRKRREDILKDKAQKRQEDIVRPQRSLDLKAQDTKTPEQKRAMRRKRFSQETKDESSYEPLEKKRDQANDKYGYYGGAGYVDNSNSANLEQAPRVSTPVGFGSVDCTSIGHTQWGRDVTKSESYSEENWSHSRSFTPKSSPYSRYSSPSPRYTPPTSAMSGRYSPCFSTPTGSPSNPNSPGHSSISPLQHLTAAPSNTIIERKASPKEEAPGSVSQKVA